MKKIRTVAVVLSMVSALLGCGGGGGDAQTPAALSNSLSLSVVDSNGTVVNGITVGGGQKIRATYTNSNGVPISSKLVTFSVTTNSGAVTLGNTMATTLDNGQALVTVAPATISTSGAATVTATVGGLTATVDFAISGTPTTVGTLIFGNSTLNSSGSTSVQTTIKVGTVPTRGVNVSFSVDCGTITPSTAVSNDSGVASTNYSAIKSDGTSCSGNVRITAIDPNDSSTGILTVTAPVASAINFVSAIPSQIYVSGSGASSQSFLKFKVLDSSGAPAINANVDVSLSNNPSGVSFDSQTLKDALSQVSDSKGEISLTLFASGIPGPVQVKAALHNNADVYAYSSNLSVWSGPPSQDHFSIAVTTYNVEGKNWDGTTTDVTVRLADRQGNAVNPNTVVNFTSSGGQIGGSCAIAWSNNIASCSTTFSSQSPRAGNGRVAILAYTEGLKNYVDNGNGVFDSGDTLTDMGDAYRDDDESGDYTAGEFVLPHGGTAVCAGAGGTVPSRANTCNPTSAAATIRRQVMLFMSGSHAVQANSIKLRSSVKFNLFDDTNFGTDIAPVYRNPMPFGTQVVATAIDTTSGPGSATCTVVSTLPSVIPNIQPKAPDRTTDPWTWTPQGTAIEITLTGCESGDMVRTVVTTPKGIVTTFTDTLP